MLIYFFSAFNKAYISLYGIDVILLIALLHIIEKERGAIIPLKKGPNPLYFLLS